MNRINLKPCKDVSFKNVVIMLRQLSYTEVEQITEYTYKALNPYKEPREFIQLEQGKDILIVSKRDFTEAMNQHKDIQDFEVEYIDEEVEGRIIIIKDYLIDRSMKPFIPNQEIPASEEDYFYL